MEDISILDSLMEKTSKYREDWNKSINAIDLVDIHRTFHSTMAEQTYSFSVHITFAWINHILNHKTCRSEFWKMRIIQTMSTNSQNKRSKLKIII